MEIIVPERYHADQFEEARRVLAEAFRDDPGFLYVTEDGEERFRVARWSLGVSLQYGHLYGSVYAVTSPLRGLAVWMSPDSWPMTIPRMARAGMFAAIYRIRPLDLVRLTRMVSFTDAVRAKLFPDPHWYLMTLGIDPAHQGKGIGSALLEQGLRQVDAAGMDCGLETENPRAVPLYQSFGFQVELESRLPRSGPPVWFMKRPPRG